MLEEQYIVESPWYQYILRKGAQKGKQEGISEGEEKGLRMAILSLVAQRFPAIADAVREQIESIDDAEELNRIVVLAGTAPDEAAFRQGFPAAPTQP